MGVEVSSQPGMIRGGARRPLSPVAVSIVVMLTGSSSAML
jgi:hypothetical protein